MITALSLIPTLVHSMTFSGIVSDIQCLIYVAVVLSRRLLLLAAQAGPGMSAWRPLSRAATMSAT